MVDQVMEFTMVMPDSTPDDNLDNQLRDTTIDVDDEGVLTTQRASDALQVTGALDPSNCTVTGNWDLFMGDTMGTFELGPRR
jgi:hypothetical protein